jgi:hypothetical protein
MSWAAVLARFGALVTCQHHYHEHQPGSWWWTCCYCNRPTTELPPPPWVPGPCRWGEPDQVERDWP